MKIGIPKESRQGEARVAATPETVRKMKLLGYEILVQHGAGDRSHFPDAAYMDAGAALVDRESTFGADLVLKLWAPDDEELGLLKGGTVLIGMLEPFNADLRHKLGSAGLTAFALELVPRTTRAQAMDVLSSQANIAGYRAITLATGLYQRFMPMLMTAAGTVKAARVLILGAGVAGLQAVATAKRLGAVIEASDVRPAAREQIESLGAKFVDVPFETDEERQAAEGKGGYAQPMPASWLERQAQKVRERATAADIVICTAFIPGKPAPLLLAENVVSEMRPGSVIVDLAAGRGQAGGGNCALSVADETVICHGVKIAGPTNLAASVATDASALYARNMLEFVRNLTAKDGSFALNMDDEIVAASLICHQGATPLAA
ncbi:Re/Si-specific NAD(P)(+) transhydrogenase subunit alpha [Paraburkholderia panacisoli]|uniref:NAD(P) transhydrogenase subunit alpha part 1 n=1 Tax=Paraburkholderia panacisoli TaxID=2603818 RepID=A0A5B0GN73_9BURK|nr:Re/Si-specific NAD(P)(+) transhydrogenase subunit alpha [Paraburkholderia panacisoli]KAA1004867.1 Re/Si-specific NAD(P)(+) transhydrogenase subunit alpha [Paraburkholderia panacisoli]